MLELYINKTRISHHNLPRVTYRFLFQQLFEWLHELIALLCLLQFQPPLWFCLSNQEYSAMSCQDFLSLSFAAPVLSIDHLLVNYNFVESMADMNCTLDVLDIAVFACIAPHLDVAVAVHIRLGVVDTAGSRSRPVAAVNTGMDYPVIVVVEKKMLVAAECIAVNLVELLDAETHGVDSYHRCLQAEEKLG